MRGFINPVVGIAVAHGAARTYDISDFPGGVDTIPLGTFVISGGVRYQCVLVGQVKTLIPT